MLIKWDEQAVTSKSEDLIKYALEGEMKTHEIQGSTTPEHIYFSVIDYAKAFDCVDHDKLWKILNRMGIPDHLTCLP